METQFDSTTKTASKAAGNSTRKNISPNGALETIQTKLTIGKANDAYEQEADQVADQVMRMPDPVSTVQRQCEDCEEEEAVQAKPLNDGITPWIQKQEEEEEPVQAKSLLQRQPEEEEEPVQTKSLIQRQPEEEEEPVQAKLMIQKQEEEEEEMLQTQADSNSSQTSSPSWIHSQIKASRGSGNPLPKTTRSFMETRFGNDFGNVRIHQNDNAMHLSRKLGAQAFTTGNDIYFNRGKYKPDSPSGQHLLAHELTHVVQQNGKKNSIQRDLALEPPQPDVIPSALTPVEMRSAIRYNQGRFQDPWTIRVIRDILGGIPQTPAIIDEAFVNKIVEWQAQRELSQDGKVGVATTRTLIAEARAEDQPRLVTQLRLDNRVRTSDATAPTYGNCRNFNWVVNWNTTLRNGWIVQEVVNTDAILQANGSPVAGPAPNVPHYWEAWRVSANGNVSPAGGDTWRRGARPNTQGNWGMLGRVYTVQSLDPAANFAAGSVATAGILMATTTRPGNLGLVELTRRAGGQWNCIPPRNTHTPV